MPGRARELQEREDQRAEHRERHRAGEDDERIAERVELRREHQEDQQRARGPSPAGTCRPPGAAGATRRCSRRGSPAAGSCAAASSSTLQRRRRASAARRPEILTALSCWKRLSVRGSTPVVQRGDALSGMSWPSGPVMWMSSSCVGREPARALDLRDDLVAAAVDVEAVDEVAAEHRRQIGADLLHGQAHRRDLVAIDDDLGSSAWSICTSMIGGNANWPLFIAVVRRAARRSAGSPRGSPSRRSRTRPGRARRSAAPAAGTPARGCR